MPGIKNPAIRERNSQRIYGCSEAEALALNSALPLRDPAGLALRYCVQRQAAKARGIDWLMSFPQWMQIWIDSGRLQQRGVGVGRFVMARHGDVGPYSPSNVQIQLAVVNSRDGLATRHERANLVHAAIKNFCPQEVIPNASQLLGDPRNG